MTLDQEEPVKRELSEEQKKDFERDVEELSLIAADFIKKVQSRTSRTFGLDKIDLSRIFKEGLGYIFNVIKEVRDDTACGFVELLVFVRCLHSVVDNLSERSAIDIEVFRTNRIAIVQIMNDTSRCIRRFRVTEFKNFKDTLKVFDECMSGTTVSGLPGYEFVDQIKYHVLETLDSTNIDKEKVRDTIEGLTDILVQFELILGIVLKWSLVAEHEFMSQMKDEVKKEVSWEQIYNRYIPALTTSLQKMIDATSLIPGPKF